MGIHVIHIDEQPLREVGVGESISYCSMKFAIHKAFDLV